jgi:hypothetical protein
MNMRRRLTFLAAALLFAGGLTAGCGGRTAGRTDFDGAGGGDSGTNGNGNGNGNGDGGTTPADGGTICGSDPLAAGFVLGTHIQPSHPEPMIDDYYVDGQVSYLGPITVPLASNPMFNKEVQIMHGDGQASVLQYYLPNNLDLPLTMNLAINLIFRRRNGFEGYTVGIVIRRPTSGRPPLLFVGETGQYGRAFEEEDPLMSPVKVYAVPDPNCPTHEDPNGCGTVYTDALLFDTSTGGIITQIELYQAESGTLEVFGIPFTMLNMASTHIVPGCPDAAGRRVAFLAITQEAFM